MSKQTWHILLFFAVFVTQKFYARSVLRPRDKTIARIETRWADANPKDRWFTLHDSHLEEYPIFKIFNQDFFFSHMLPQENISFRYEPDKQISGKILEKLINYVLEEIEQKKKVFRDFIVLRRRDFNRRKRSGLIILKCKHYPFVVKIFKEDPKSFILHKTKGVVPSFFFYMSGGINRHLLGFTRIKNLEDMQARLDLSARWKNKVTMPRKWFFVPEKSRWIKIKGFNIGKTKNPQTEIPGTYCLVSDWVNGERTASMFNKKDRTICMDLCNFLELAIDPHIDNFMFERNTGKIAIVDTEHFLSVVGMRETKTFRGYIPWIIHLSGIGLESMYFRTKKRRKLLQQQEWGSTQLCYGKPTDKSPAPYA